MHINIIVIVVVVAGPLGVVDVEHRGVMGGMTNSSCLLDVG